MTLPLSQVGPVFTPTCWSVTGCQLPLEGIVTLERVFSSSSLQANSWGPNLASLPAAGGISPSFLKGCLDHSSQHPLKLPSYRSSAGVKISAQKSSSVNVPWLMSSYLPISVNFRVWQISHSNWNAKRRSVWKDKPSDWRKEHKGKLYQSDLIVMVCWLTVGTKSEPHEGSTWGHWERPVSRCHVSSESDLKVMHSSFSISCVSVLEILRDHWGEWRTCPYTLTNLILPADPQGPLILTQASSASPEIRKW